MVGRAAQFPGLRPRAWPTAARFVERLGAGKALQGAPGRIEGELSWPGSPLEPEVAQLRGKLAVALGEGRFLNAEPGVARLFGVLSLQALPRRLLLDFRDVFQQGIAFDRVDRRHRAGRRRRAHRQSARARRAGGGADRRQRRPAAARPRTCASSPCPRSNAGTASLAYAALNPAVGLGTFLAQLLLREPLMAAGTREFHVTGPWADPQVERVERGAAPGDRAAASARQAAPRNRTP